MRALLLYLLRLTLLLSLLTSCEHRPLQDFVNAHYIRVYVDENIRNVTFGFYNEQYDRPEHERPRVIRVVLADPVSGTIISERYLQNQGVDSMGYYLDGYIGAPAGRYNMLLYNFGSPRTLIGNEQNYFAMQGYTEQVSDYYLQYLPAVRQTIDERQIVQQPDHLFHAVQEDIIINKNEIVDTLLDDNGSYFKAHSMVKSYYIQIKVKGIEWAISAVSLLSGMAGSSLIHQHEGMIESDSVHVLLTLTPTERKRSGPDGNTTATLYTTFNTFGKLPDIPSHLTITFEFTKRDGSSQIEEIDITDMFDTPLVRDQQWILLDHEIELTPPEGSPIDGGLTPGVDEWTDIESEIII
ncbi:MAG: DUF5119 domain-containing protein [Bacteroidaceae bacterium]|nr:DUF5119 domain-containing protein [Bacteroidaceae bacterium]